MSGKEALHEQQAEEEVLGQFIRKFLCSRTFQRQGDMKEILDNDNYDATRSVQFNKIILFFIS